MEHVKKQIEALRAQLPDTVTLVAVSKFQPAEAIMEAYEAGQRVFGESRANELAAKASALPADITWHFIGHLQTNKARIVVAHADLIQSVDSEKLLRLIDSESRRAGKVTDILLQVHVAKEDTKFGFLPDELTSMVASGMLAELPNVRVRGVMGMASNVDDPDRIAADFSAIRLAFDTVAAMNLPATEAFDTISMGMSDDYPLAVALGSNMVRIGTSIFGAREQPTAK